MNTVKKLLGLCLFGTFLPYHLYAQTVPQVFSDSFSDGKIDKALWLKPSWAVFKSQEASGHLLLFNNPTNTAKSQYTGLFANFARKYNKGDTLSVSAKIRMPHKIPADPGGPITNGFEVGIGILQSMTLANTIELTVRDTQSNRQFGVYYYSQSLNKSQYFTVPAPTNITVFKLKMTYSSATDNVGFYWAPATSTTWTKLTKYIKMASMFGPASVKTMEPYITGGSEKTLVLRDWNVWIDDFMAVYWNKPL